MSTPAPIILERPLIVLDLETTGLDLLKDQIIEIGMWKIFPDMTSLYYERQIKPNCKMHPQASEVLGIKDEDLVNNTPFIEVAQEAADFLTGCDIAGFNSDKFDIPILMEEFARAGVDFEFKGILTVDVMKIFHSFERRNLAAASQFYLGAELQDGHTVKADIMATGKILMKMVTQYPSIGNTMKTLKEYSYRGDWADFTGHLSYNDMGKVTFNFGKYKGQTVESAAMTDPKYIEWIASSDFSNYTKKLIRKELVKAQGAFDPIKPTDEFPFHNIEE